MMDLSLILSFNISFQCLACQAYHCHCHSARVLHYTTHCLGRINESSHRTNQSLTFSPHLTADGQAESTYAKSFTDTGEWRVSRVFLFPVMPLTELTIPDLILDIFLSSSQNDNIPYSFSASLLLKSGFLISFLSRLPRVRHQDGHC